MPSNFDFLSTFDMFFKCHKIFHIEYSPSIVKLMHFIDHYFFDDDSEAAVTVTMKKIAEKLDIPSIFRKPSIADDIAHAESAD